MLETLAHLDAQIFLFLNVELANYITDPIWVVLTNSTQLRTLYGLAMVILLWKGNARLRWLVLFSMIALVLSDQIASHLLKPMIGRIRPCHVMENINLLVGCGGGKAMPSSHAANAFAQAALFATLYRVTRWPLWIYASLVAISRVFVGVHYPGDVLAGAGLGTGIGIGVALLFDRVAERWLPGCKRRIDADQD